MNTTLGFSYRNALDPVCTGFKFQPGVSSFSFDHKGDFFVTADTDFIFGKDLNMPSACFRIMCIHTEEVCRKKRCFITSGTGTDLNDNIL